MNEPVDLQAFRIIRQVDFLVEEMFAPSEKQESRIATPIGFKRALNQRGNRLIPFHKWGEEGSQTENEKKVMRCYKNNA